MENDLSEMNLEPVLMMETASLDFGGGAGVFDLDFALPGGAILGVIGPSGCGKTTTIRLLNGIFSPTAGEVRVFGKKPVEFDNQEKGRLGYIPQQFILYPNLSVEENLSFLGGIYGMTGDERKAKIPPLLDFVELSEARKRTARKLSGGMQRRLMLAGALLHEPDLLFADEPTAGIDPILRARIWENFRALRDQGKTLLVTTQYVGEAAYCDQVAVMRRGRLVAIDTPQGLRRRALGGELIYLQVEEAQLTNVVRLLTELPDVKNLDLIQSDPGGLYVLVDEAGKALPILLTMLQEKLGLSPRVAEPFSPSFDEIFVRLIRQAEAEQ